MKIRLNQLLSQYKSIILELIKLVKVSLLLKTTNSALQFSLVAVSLMKIVIPYVEF